MSKSAVCLPFEAKFIGDSSNVYIFSNMTRYEWIGFIVVGQFIEEFISSLQLKFSK